MKTYLYTQWSIPSCLVEGRGIHKYPDSKFHGANMGPTSVLSAPDGPHIGPMNLAIRVYHDLNLHSLSFFFMNQKPKADVFERSMEYCMHIAV